MAITTTVSSKELQRIAALAYEGKTLNVMLCTLGVGTFNAESTVANWQTVEKSGNGYARYSEQIGIGSYSTTDGRYNLPNIYAEFTAGGVGYSFSHVILYITGQTYLHSMLVESPAVILLPGQSQSYKITLAQDD